MTDILPATPMGEPASPATPPAMTPASGHASRWRKKPVIIEARQLVDDIRNHTEIAAWIEGGGGTALIPFAEPCLYIETLEGRHRADIGDWVIKGVKGEFYPCKPDIFDATYEPASPLAAPPGPGAMTPEQAAYEAHFAALRNTFDSPPWAWERLPFHLSQAWKAAALAAIGEYAKILADVTEQRDEAREERDQLSRVVSKHERALYAIWIDTIRHSPGEVLSILHEALDGFDGEPWNEAESGTEWLERTRGEMDEPSGDTGDGADG